MKKTILLILSLVIFTLLIIGACYLFIHLSRVCPSVAFLLGQLNIVCSIGLGFIEAKITDKILEI